jgi:DNA-binding transcriptional LysR family regulator
MPLRGSLRTPEISELRAFCAAVDLGTIGRAAVALKVSQPALSKRLRSLEAVAGAELLERSPRGVTLTAAGRRLYPEARRLLDQADVVERVLEGVHGERIPIRLAVSHTIAEFYLPPELVGYQADGERRPPVELMIANSGAVRRMVADGQAEIGITAAELSASPDDGLEELELMDDEVIVAVPRDHLWYRRKTIPQRALLETPLVMRDPNAHDRRCVEAVLNERGLEIAEALVEVGSTAVAKREALERKAPVLLSALSLDEARDRLHARPVEGLRFPRRFVIVCGALATLPRQDREFIDFLLRRRTDHPPSES